MSLANVAYNASFGWEDRRSSLESQMEVPMNNELPVEMGLKGNEAEVLAPVRARFAHMASGFARRSPARTRPSRCRTSSKRLRRSSACSCQATRRSIGISTRTITAACRLRRSAVPPCFSPTGFRCSECHGSVNISGPTIFTGAMPSDPEAFFHDTGVAASRRSSARPTLRNIAVTAPYMHDGSIETLKEVVMPTMRPADAINGPRATKCAALSISPSETTISSRFWRR